MEIVDSLHNIATEIVDTKKAALVRGDDGVTQQVGERRDIISKLRE